MNWKQTLINVLGIVLLLLIISALCLPYYLVIKFAIVATYITEIAKVNIPWIVILILILVFNEQIKSVIFNIGDLVKRTRKGAFGPITVDTQQDTQGKPADLTNEQLLENLGKMQQEKNTMLNILQHYHFTTMYLTIYRSQIELLVFLENQNSPVDKNQLKIFYELACSRNRELFKYPFESYIDYLKNNYFIIIDENNKVTITNPAKQFLEDLRNKKISLEAFKS